MMKLLKKPIGLLLSLILVITLLLPAGAGTKQASAFTTANADAAMTALINVFYDSSAKYFYVNSDHQIHTEHAHGPDGGLYTDFWWEAQLWETVMDAYERTGSSTYRTMIDDIYTGFNAKYTNMISNVFYDDLGWWALASLRAYEITGTVEYLNRGSFLFNHIYDNGWSTANYGGGIWWRSDANNPATSTNAQKNMATNAPMVMTAVKLRNAYNDNSYLTKAQTIYNWTKSKLVTSTKVNDHMEGTGAGIVKDWDFTYNYGTFLGAALALYQATGTGSYLTDANFAANYVIDKMTSATTLLYEGENDAPGFKMIFARNLNQLRVQAGQSQYLGFLQSNATQAWNHRRTSDNIIGSDWSRPTGSGYIQSLAAAGASILQLVPADGYTGNIAGNGVYEAENARRTLVAAAGMVNESTQSGFNGRGYVAGWNTNGTSIDFYVNQNAAGSKTITFRYAGGAGNASRYVKVNGVVVSNNLSFNGTGGWGSWNTVSLTINLNAGSNTIQLGYNSSLGNSNYLNVDRLTGL